MTNEELLKQLEDLTKDAMHHQVHTLLSILQHQCGVIYLRQHFSGQDAPIDVTAFKRAVPLSSYDDYADYINQLADGTANHDQPLLSVDPLVCFFSSTGTSSMKPKLIPYFDSALSKAASFLGHQGSGALLKRLFPPRPEISKIMWFLYGDNITITKGGMKVMAASTYPLQSGNSNASQSMLLSFTSPREVILGSNFEQQIYCHLLCGLRNFDLVDGIRAPYAIGLIKAFDLLESKWEQLCDDVEKGFPSLEINDVSMRDSVVQVLGGPQPDLSKRIQSFCEEKNWGGIVSKLWPNTQYIRCVTTGSMKHYYSRLAHYAGEVPILGGDYFASECCVGINLDIQQPPESTRFVMLPTAAYFEFLPFDSKENKTIAEEIVDFDGVEIGKMYEVVVTTYRGLYRCRLGDIVKVVGFYNSSPEVEFVMRAPKTSSEIVTEKDLMSAVERFQLELRNMGIVIEIMEFSCSIHIDVNKRLKIFLEIEDGCMLLQEDQLQNSIPVLKRCSSFLEDTMGGIYKVQKDRGELCPLAISILKPGSFDHLRQIAISKGAPASQYKVPRILRNHEFVDLLEASALVTIN
ncbi:hypothetical protein SLE2022_206670 [Rubroshorea leprosula]